MIVLLLHCEGGDGTTNFVDSSYPSTTVETKGGARISASNYKFGSTCGLFEGGGEKNILRLHFDGTPGTSVFTDSSPSVRNLTVNGTPVISNLSSVWGTAAAFDGLSFLSDLHTQYIIYSDMSFDVYLLFEQIDTKQDILTIDKSHAKGLEFYFDQNQIVLRFGDTIISAPWIPELNKFYLVSMSRFGAYIYIRIDGKEVARGFRKTGLLIKDSVLQLSNPNIPLYSPIFFSRYIPGPITALEYNANISPTISAKALARQNISISEEDLIDAPELINLTDNLLGLEGRVYVGLYLASVDGSQITIDDIHFHYAADEYFDGTLTKIQINKFEGKEESDVLLRVPTPNVANSNLSNILFRVDGEPVPYTVLYSNLNETGLIIKSTNKRDNLTTHLNSGSEVHWNSVGLDGSSLDWSGSNGGVKQIGYWGLNDGYWILTQPGALKSTVSSDLFSFLINVKAITSDTFRMTISLGAISLEVKFDDSVIFFTIDNEEYNKTALPWGTQEHQFTVQRYLTGLIFKVDGSVIVTLPDSLGEEVDIEVTFDQFEENASVGVRSYYSGPLVYGNTKTNFHSDLDYNYLTNDFPLATGYMLYAGIPDLDSVGLLYATKFHIFLDDEKLSLPLPPDFSSNSKILGFQDTKTTNSIFFYGVNNKTYYFDTEWHLLGNFKLIDLYKDQWGEGIVYQEIASVYWVRLFEREDDKLVLTGDKSLFSVIPTDTEYKLESTIDYRKRKGTIPWIWMRNKK